MTTFEEDLAAAQAPEDEYADVPVLINKKLHTLRFRPMDGLAWAAETDRHPPRPNVAIDGKYGYNIRSLTKGAAPQCGVLVIDGEEHQLQVDPFDPEHPTAERVNQWEQLFKAISGYEFKRITDVIWFLNEFGPQEDIKAAGKALADSAKN
ncbi:hypothetical protein NY057_05285 [Curtobacterium flaccumfaciens]|uniref:hypothetical protein n=1 Tax=Curtobacterium flaccumfaciens TaxID=2035 RepID=UPI00220A2A10|nr:hypothetical protein [Curtobacterium flaccumfaciens]UWD83659.1 hypothetical protein NY057_05285 [Curtobacterium flaccumfaciens]